MQRILLIDDEPAILAAVGDYLRRRGYAVNVAHGRAEAEALLQEHGYDCVISDLELENASADRGIQLVASVLRQWPKARVVVLTANSHLRYEREAVALGVDAFLLKPIPLANLARIVGALLAGPR